MAFLTVTSLVVSRVARLGVTEATVVFAAQTPVRRPALFSNLLLATGASASASAVVVCGVLIAFPGIRPGGIGDVELGLLAAGLLTSALVDAGYAFLLGCGRFRPHALVTSAASWLYAGLLAVAWEDGGLTVARAMLAWAIAQGVRGLALLATCLHDVRPGLPTVGLLRESVGFGLRAWVGTLAHFFSFRLDQILMAFIAAESSLGMYAVAVNASEVLLYLPQATTSVIVPLVSASVPEQRSDQTLRAFRSLALVTAGSVAVGAVLGPVLLPVVFGGAYHGSVAPFLWLLPSTFGYVALGVFSNALLASGSPGWSSFGPLASLVLGIALDLALIPPLQASGAAIAASISYIAGGLVALAAYRRVHHFAWRALAIPQRHDLVMLRALAGPLAGRAALPLRIGARWEREA